MKLLTVGRLMISPVQVAVGGDAPSLSDLEGMINDQLYPGAPVARGWGGTLVGSGEEDGPQELIQRRSDPGSAALYELDGREFILARFLYDRPRAGLARDFGPEELQEFGARRTHELFGIDCVFLPEDEGFGVLVNTRNEREVVGSIYPALRKLVGDDRDVTVRAHPGFVPDPDLFLWLLYRLDGRQEIGQSLDLDSIRSLNSHDGLDRNIRFLDAVALDRAAVLSEVMNPDRQFGPAKFAVTHAELGLTADLFLDLEGTFDVHVSRSFFHDDDEDDATRPWFGPLLVHSVATTVLPGLYRAHQEDGAWTSQQRSEFRASCRERLETEIDRVR